MHTGARGPPDASALLQEVSAVSVMAAGGRMLYCGPRLLPDGTGRQNSGLVRSFTPHEMLWGYEDALANVPGVGELLSAYHGFAGPACATACAGNCSGRSV